MITGKPFRLRHNNTDTARAPAQRLSMVSAFVMRCVALFAAMIPMLGTVQTAAAQVYDTTTTGTIDGSISCADTARLTRTITVPDTFIVDDLNVGFFATHSWRGDIELSLTPPDGAPTIQLIASDVNTIDEDNYNIELDDSAGNAINTAPHNTNDGTTAPPTVASYENLVQPSSTTPGLSGFTGEAANGDWTLSMCDAFPGADNGQFRSATLYFTTLTGADLSLVGSASDTSPAYGTTVNLQYTLTNGGPDAATGTRVLIDLPAGLTYDSHTGNGNFNTTNNRWNAGTLAVGQSKTMTITATVENSGSYVTDAEVILVNESDPDSTPANNSTTEDDDVRITLSPVAAPPPPLVCSASEQFTHSWDAPGGTNGWNPGDLTGSYTSGGQTLDITISGSTDNFIPRNGIATPASTSEFNGGNGGTTFGLTMYVDFDSTADEIIMDMDVGTPGIGVGDLQFYVYDLDLGSWTDRIRVDGFLGTNSVTPILSPSSGNTVQGNAIVGTGGSSSTQGNGNAGFTFNGSVDRIRLTYDNINTAANPAPQIISVMGMTMCPPVDNVDLSAEKTVEMYDPTGAGQDTIYAIPGNEVLYKITVTNAATSTTAANDIDLEDILPENLRFVEANVTGFTGGSFTGPPLPPTNTDCAAGACVISYEGATLPVNTTGEIAIRAIVK